MKKTICGNKRYLVLAVLFVLTLPTACALQTNVETLPDVGIPVENLNTQLSVIAPEGWNTFKINEPIELEIYVIGDQQIIFQPDFGVKAFLYDRDKDEWRDVLETVPIIYPDGKVILSPSDGNPFMAGTTEIFPLFPDTTSPILLRIFVFGHVYYNGKATDEKVGAYVDVILHP